MMKYPILLALGCLTLFVLLACGPEEEEEMIIDEPECEPINLSGDWLAKGYRCELEVFHETIAIVHNLMTEHLVANKITGDPCVLAGDQTFQGTFDGCANAFDISWTWGTPTNPGSGTDVGFVLVHNDSLIEVRLNETVDCERLN